MILRPIIFQKKKKHIHQVVYASLDRKMLMVLACDVDLLFNIVEKGCSCTLEAVDDHTYLLLPNSVSTIRICYPMLLKKDVRISITTISCNFKYSTCSIYSYNQLQNCPSPVDSSGAGELVAGLAWLARASSKDKSRMTKILSHTDAA